MKHNKKMNFGRCKMFDYDFIFNIDSIDEMFWDESLKKYLMGWLSHTEIKEEIDNFTHNMLNSCTTEDRIYEILINVCCERRAATATKILIVKEFSKAVKFLFACDNPSKIWFIRNCYKSIIIHPTIKIDLSQCTTFNRIIEILMGYGYKNDGDLVISDVRFMNLIAAYRTNDAGLFFELCMDALLIPASIHTNNYENVGEMIEGGAFIPYMEYGSYLTIRSILEEQKRKRELYILNNCLGLIN